MPHTQGIPTVGGNYSAIPVDIFGIAIDWFGPRNPLLKMLAKLPNGSPEYKLAVGSFRSRSTTLGGAVGDTSTTTITLASASIAQQFMKGDVLRLASGEYVEVSADPTSGSANLTVIRGVAGSTAATQSNGSTVRVVTNARTGSTDNPTAYSASRSLSAQYAQTILHPYAVGGAVQSSTGFPVAPGAPTPLDQYRMEAVQNWMDDAEMAAIFGKGESASSSSSGSAKMAGLKNILTTNNATTPTNYSVYKATDFQRDLLDTPRASGGAPNVIFVASNWMSAFTLWAQPLSYIAELDSRYGRNVRIWSAPFLGDVDIVEHSLLPSFTAFSLRKEEVTWQVKRPMKDEPFGKSGDNTKGQIVGELSIAVENEAHHAWLEGVTAFSV